MTDGTGFLIGLAIVVAFLLVIGEANGAEQSRLPQGYTCEQVRAYVAERGKFAALISAKLHGASREQIRAAKECLK